MNKQILNIEEVASRKLKEGSGFILTDLKGITEKKDCSIPNREDLLKLCWNHLIDFKALGINELRGKDILFYQDREYLSSMRHMPLQITTSISNITCCCKGWVDRLAILLKRHSIPIVWLASDKDEAKRWTSTIRPDDIIILQMMHENGEINGSFSSDTSLGKRLNRWIRGKTAIFIGDIQYSHELACILWQLNMDLVIIETGDSIIGNTAIEGIHKESLLMVSDSLGYPQKEHKNHPSPANYRPGVTAIINLYKRHDKLLEIYKSLTRQSQPVSAIYVWINSELSYVSAKRLRQQMPRARIIASDENLGVWARFAFANLVSTKYCCIFDDDTVPGIRWIENCLVNSLRRPGLLGTVGLIYKDRYHYMNHTRVGWPSQNSNSIDVDIVGHSWFFQTSFLKYYWAEIQRIEGTDFCGEDMHFSYALQKYNIPTYVPPHPSHDRDLWGSIHPEYGTDEDAISISGKGSYMDLPFKQLQENGWRLLHQQTLVKE